MEKAIFIIASILIVTLSADVLCAQDRDKEQVERHAKIGNDIKILSSVLEEIFQTRWEAKGNVVRIGSGSFSFGRDNRITGSYLQDYGVVFRIKGGPQAFVLSTNAGGEASSFHFQTSNGQEEKVTEESIIRRIKEFLRDYGSTIEPLKDDEKVTVMYERNRPENFFSIQVPSSSGKKEEQMSESQLLFKIVVSATRADLLAFRRDAISDQQFDNRLKIQTIEEDDAEKRDLKIMASILEASLKGSESDELKIQGSVDESYITGLGAVFYINASYESGFSGLSEALISVRKKLSEIKLDTLKIDSLFAGNLDSGTSKSSEKDRKKAFEKFLMGLKETIIDYGGTLKSVSSDEQIYVSLSIRSPGVEVPDQVELLLKKSTLEALNVENISREEAIEQINDIEIYRYDGREKRSYTLPHVPVHN